MKSGWPYSTVLNLGDPKAFQSCTLPVPRMGNVHSTIELDSPAGYQVRSIIYQPGITTADPETRVPSSPTIMGVLGSYVLLTGAFPNFLLSRSRRPTFLLRFTHSICSGVRGTSEYSVHQASLS